jgi:hypothetical protein
MRGHSHPFLEISPEKDKDRIVALTVDLGLYAHFPKFDRFFAILTHFFLFFGNGWIPVVIPRFSSSHEHPFLSKRF